MKPVTVNLDGGAALTPGILIDHTANTLAKAGVPAVLRRMVTASLSNHAARIIKWRDRTHRVEVQDEDGTVILAVDYTYAGEQATDGGDNPDYEAPAACTCPLCTLEALGRTARQVQPEALFELVDDVAYRIAQECGIAAKTSALFQLGYGHGLTDGRAEMEGAKEAAAETTDAPLTVEQMLDTVMRLKAAAKPMAAEPDEYRLVPADVPGYERLSDVLLRAYEQAAKGKGAERHANNLPFHEQPMQQLADQFGRGFLLGQAGKKMQESQGMDKDAAVRELLGAINYIAGAIIHIENN